MYQFFIAFMGVFFAGQSAAVIFSFSSSTYHSSLHQVAEDRSELIPTVFRHHKGQRCSQLHLLDATPRTHDPRDGKQPKEYSQGWSEIHRHEKFTVCLPTSTRVEGSEGRLFRGTPSPNPSTIQPHLYEETQVH